MIQRKHECVWDLLECLQRPMTQNVCVKAALIKSWTHSHSHTHTHTQCESFNEHMMNADLSTLQHCSGGSSKPAENIQNSFSRNAQKEASKACWISCFGISGPSWDQSWSFACGLGLRQGSPSSVLEGRCPCRF